MTKEDDMLFQGPESAQESSSKFRPNAPPAKEIAAAVAELDLESAIGLGQQPEAVIDPKRARRAGAPPIEFATPAPAPAPTTAPRVKEKPRAMRGPMAVEPERIAAIEKPSFLARVCRALFGWMRTR